VASVVSSEAARVRQRSSRSVRRWRSATGGWPGGWCSRARSAGGP